MLRPWALVAAAAAAACLAASVCAEGNRFELTIIQYQHPIEGDEDFYLKKVASTIAMAREHGAGNVLVLNTGGTKRTLKKVNIPENVRAAATAFSLRDFDAGIGGLMARIAGSPETFVAANFQSSLLKRFVAKSVVKEIGGRKIGVIGYVSPFLNILLNDEQTGEQDIPGIVAETVAIRDEVRRMKAAGVDIIIAIGNSGHDRNAEIARSVPDLDAVVSAPIELRAGLTDTFPQLIRQPWNSVVPLLEIPTSNEQLIGVTRLVFDNKGILKKGLGMFKEVTGNTTHEMETETVKFLELDAIEGSGDTSANDVWDLSAVQDVVKEVAQSVGQQVQIAAQTVGNHAQDVVQTVGQEVQEVAEVVGQQVQGVKDALEPARPTDIQFSPAAEELLEVSGAPGQFQDAEPEAAGSMPAGEAVRPTQESPAPVPSPAAGGQYAALAALAHAGQGQGSGSTTERVQSVTDRVIGAAMTPIIGLRRTCALSECDMGKVIADAIKWRLGYRINAAMVDSGVFNGIWSRGDIRESDVDNVLREQTRLYIGRLRGDKFNQLMKEATGRHTRLYHMSGMSALYEMSTGNVRDVLVECRSCVPRRMKAPEPHLPYTLAFAARDDMVKPEAFSDISDTQLSLRDDILIPYIQHARELRAPEDIRMTMVHTIPARPASRPTSASASSPSNNRIQTSGQSASLAAQLAAQQIAADSRPSSSVQQPHEQVTMAVQLPSAQSAGGQQVIPQTFVVQTDTDDYNEAVMEAIQMAVQAGYSPAGFTTLLNAAGTAADASVTSAQQISIPFAADGTSGPGDQSLALPSAPGAAGAAGTTEETNTGLFGLPAPSWPTAPPAVAQYLPNVTLPDLSALPRPNRNWLLAIVGVPAALLATSLIGGAVL